MSFSSKLGDKQNLLNFKLKNKQINKFKDLYGKNIQTSNSQLNSKRSTNNIYREKNKSGR